MRPWCCVLLVVAALCGGGSGLAVPAVLMAPSRLLPAAPPAGAVSAARWHELVRWLARRCATLVVFVERELSVEALSCRDERGPVFPHLAARLRAGDALYLPAVERPYELLLDALPATASNTLRLREPAWALLNATRDEPHLYVLLEESPGEPRDAALRRHDSIVENVLSGLRARGGAALPVAAVLTGASAAPPAAPLVAPRVRRRAPVVRAFKLETPNVLIRLHAVVVRTALHSSTVHEIPLIWDKIMPDNRYSARLFFNDFEIDFAFELTNTSWKLG